MSSISKLPLEKAPIVLLLPNEIGSRLKVKKEKLNAYLEDGMPHFLIGNDYRFLESEVVEWHKTYQPSQERLENDFRDQKGRTIQEYVTQETILATLRITKENLQALCKKGMPFERVGEKEFFHIQDILEHYRKGAVGKTKEPVTNQSKQKLLNPVNGTIPKDTYMIVVDGSYNFDIHIAGTGIVVFKHNQTVTGISNVRNLKTTKSIVSEFLALFDALRWMKKKNINKAIIVTDQEPWSKGISIGENSYQGSVKPFIKLFNQLLTELKGKFEVKFVGEISEGKNNVLYKKAHKLSQEYKKGTFNNLKLE
ncbi:reverse transcriptase-like protein [Neobacillus drentensis]|uniref:reverse transcriptase-like protein n=1 Tax=Neobacillus drentensis TaxID=220684 RepID=UPI002FFFEF76